jgi:hypothetical protein
MRGIFVKQNDAEMFRTLPVNPMIRESAALVKKKTSKNPAFWLFLAIIRFGRPIKRAEGG